MKNYLITIIASVITSMLLFSCSRIEPAEADFQEKSPESVQMTFNVSHEEDFTKALLKEGHLVEWEAGDSIVIMTQKVADAELTAAGGTNYSKIKALESGTPVSFSGSVTLGTKGSYKDWFFGLYPYTTESYLRLNEKDGSTKKLNIFYAPMGSTQLAVKDGFSKATSPTGGYNKLPSAAMYSVSKFDPTSAEQKLDMKNAYSIIKFRIEGSDVTQLDFNIGDKTIVATKCAIEPTDEPMNWSSYTVVPWSGSDNSKTLRVIPAAGAGNTFEPGTYYVSLAPVSGIPTVYVHKKNQMAKLVGNSSVSLGRSTIYPMGVTTAIDKLSSDYKEIKNDTVTLDFTSSCPFEGFPTTATSFTTQTAFTTADGRSFSFYNKSSSTFRYDGTNKWLEINYKSGGYTSIIPPVYEGKRISKFSVIAKASATTVSFSLGSNNGGATSYSTSKFNNTAKFLTREKECAYSTPNNIWYLKPSNTTATYYVQKIIIYYSQN